MTILGIDPGLERIGYGIVRREGSRLTPITYGLIQTPKIALPDRVRLAHEQVVKLIDEHNPDAMATERLLFTVNKTNAMDVAKALGVVLLAASLKGITWAEYSPPEVKQSVVGTGSADKKQVAFMVTKLLNLQNEPKPDDVCDALAVAITHAFRSRIAVPKQNYLQMFNVRWRGGMAFEAEVPSGNNFIIDAITESGGNNQGPTPVEAFLSAAAACSGMDVILILQKKKQVVTDYHIEIEWQRPPQGQYPRPILSMIIRHVLKGENLDPAAVQRAVELSDEKYCTIITTLRHAPPVSSEYRIE